MNPYTGFGLSALTPEMVAKMKRFEDARTLLHETIRQAGLTYRISQIFDVVQEWTDEARISAINYDYADAMNDMSSLLAAGNLPWLDPIPPNM